MSYVDPLLHFPHFDEGSHICLVAHRNLEVTVVGVVGYIGYLCFKNNRFEYMIPLLGHGIKDIAPSRSGASFLTRYLYQKTHQCTNSVHFDQLALHF